MPENAVKPPDQSFIDYADHTVEMDIRWMLNDKSNTPTQPRDASSTNDDPTVVLDLTATQVHELLNDKK
jgi:hypothetical protein